MNIVRTLFLEGSVGKLEAIYNPKENPSFLAVCCHPHPLYKGTMHNKTIVAASRCLSQLGGSVIRFNFRGVMSSGGSYDNGIGEEEDVRTACDFLIEDSGQPNIPLLICGFSFGAWVGLKQGSKDSRVSHLIGLGLPLRLFEAFFLETLTKPKLIIWGDQDEFNPMDKIEYIKSKIAEPKTIYIIQNTDHFFLDKLAEMQNFISSWMIKHVIEP